MVSAGVWTFFSEQLAIRQAEAERIAASEALPAEAKREALATLMREMSLLAGACAENTTEHIMWLTKLVDSLLKAPAAEQTSLSTALLQREALEAHLYKMALAAEGRAGADREDKNDDDDAFLLECQRAGADGRAKKRTRTSGHATLYSQ